MEESRCNEAIPVYSEIIRNPSINANLRVTAYNNRGVCRNEIGDYYKAISDLYVALEMNPNYAISYIDEKEIDPTTKCKKEEQGLTQQEIFKKICQEQH